MKIGKNRAFIETKNDRALMALDYKGDDSRKWIVIAYKQDAPNPAKPHSIKTSNYYLKIVHIKPLIR
ncbi:hypothetical protein CCZ01_09790 [Helicobacter monodelphidis]|nr:hypothetical protein CCZ01_09790 [Helicobacter sp. 15-1451]